MNAGGLGDTGETLRHAPAAWAGPVPDARLLSPLGVPLRARSRSAAALNAVEALCRDWHAPVDEPSRRPLHLRIEISDVDAAPCEPSLHAQAGRLELHADGSTAGWADCERGEAACTVARSWLSSAGLQQQIIEPLLLFLLSHADRTPIHASAFLVDGLAVVLAGPSGSGKSCLAHAAQRTGLPVLSDDTVHVQLQPRLRVRGLPRPIHLFPGDAPAHSQELRWRNGKLKCAVPLAKPGALAADRAILCRLDRGARAGIAFVKGAPATDSFPSLEPGFDLLPIHSRRAMEALTAKGFARLTLSGNPDEAIALLLAERASLASVAAP